MKGSGHRNKAVMSAYIVAGESCCILQDPEALHCCYVKPHIWRLMAFIQRKKKSWYEHTWDLTGAPWHLTGVPWHHLPVFVLFFLSVCLNILLWCKHVEGPWEVPAVCKCAVKVAAVLVQWVTGDWTDHLHNLSNVISRALWRCNPIR